MRACHIISWQTHPLQTHVVQVQFLHVATKALEGIVRDASHGVPPQGELLHHSQFAHGRAGIGGHLVPVQVKYGQVLHLVQRARVQCAQLVPAHVQPAQAFSPCEGPGPQLAQLVAVELQDEEVDHWQEEALAQVADLITVEVEVGELSQVLEGAGLDAAYLIVGQVQVDELLQAFEGLGADLAQLAVLHVQRDQALALTEGPGGDAAQVVPLQVQQAGDLRHPGDLPESHAVTDDVLEVSVAVAQAGALTREPLRGRAQSQEAGPQQQPAAAAHVGVDEKEKH